MSAEVIDLNKYRGKDTATALRTIADEIEAGTHGEDVEFLLCMFGNRFHLYGVVQNQGLMEGGTAMLMIEAAKLRLVRFVEEYNGK